MTGAVPDSVGPADPRHTTVLIVGGGPTGLTLALELADRGIGVRVLERRSAPGTTSRAFGLMSRTLEQLDMRGRADAFVARGVKSDEAPLGDLRSFLHYGRLDTPFPYILIIPQSRTEQVLEQYARAAGVDIVRGVEVLDVEQGPRSVTVRVTDQVKEWTERADYLVGCDGARSRVREQAGIPVTSRAFAQSLIIADVLLRHPPDPEVNARITDDGMVAVFPFGDGLFRLIVMDRDRMGVPVEEPVTVAEVQHSVDRIFGTPLGIHGPVWLSRFRATQIQAQRYRAGRILLAGDAAHTFNPSGGQGLQFGVQDAINLGWKLAAEIRGRAPTGLLDSYESERRPIAADTLRKTELNFRFESSNSVLARTVRRIGMRALAWGPVQTPVMSAFAGLSLRYQRPRSAHRMVGRRLPDARLEPRDGTSTRLHELLRQGGFVLLDASPSGRARALAGAGWSDRVRATDITPVAGRRWPEVVLVRPDGYVAYAGRAAALDALGDALTTWCGPADPGSPPGPATPVRADRLSTLGGTDD